MADIAEAELERAERELAKFETTMKRLWGEKYMNTPQYKSALQEVATTPRSAHSAITDRIPGVI